VRISSVVTLISARIQVESRRSKQALLGYGARIVTRADRFGRILELLARDGSVSVVALAGDLGVSEATVRRDLQLLGEQRLLERSHGGAVAQGTAHELPVRYRTGRSEEKQRIARAAAERVTDGMAIGLTGGTTTTEVARALAARPDLTVVTNALNIAVELAVRANLKLIVTGGVARSASYELVGPLADATLQGIYVDLAFVGVDGIHSARGLTTQNEVEAATNRALIARAGRTIVVADGSKLAHVAFAFIAGLDSVEELLTSADADPAEVERLRAAGLRVTLV
jgi:DeoR family transcriptional regulator, aga operon transcriptional repressor